MQIIQQVFKTVIIIFVLVILLFSFYFLFPKYHFIQHEDVLMRCNRITGKIELWNPHKWEWVVLKQNPRGPYDDVGFVPDNKTDGQ